MSFEKGDIVRLNQEGLMQQISDLGEDMREELESAEAEIIGLNAAESIYPFHGPTYKILWLDVDGEDIEDVIEECVIEKTSSKQALSTDSLEEAYKSGWDRGYEAYGPAGRGADGWPESAPAGLSAEDTEEWWLGYNAGMYDAEQEDMNIDTGVGSAMIEGGESI